MVPENGLEGGRQLLEPLHRHVVGRHPDAVVAPDHPREIPVFEHPDRCAVLAELGVSVGRLGVKAESFVFGEADEVGGLVEVGSEVELFDVVVGEVRDAPEFVSDGRSTDRHQFVREFLVDCVAFHAHR